MSAESDIRQAIFAYLSENAWFGDPSASERSLKFNLMFAAGHSVDVDGGAPSYLFTGEHCGDLIAMATEGDRIAHDALVSIAEHLTERHLPLTHDLQRYVLEVARHGRPKAKPGKHPIGNLHRDEAIYQAVLIATRMGLQPTRGDVSATVGIRPSGCSIVAEVVCLSEDAIEKIWKRRQLARRRAGFND
ncbi:MAG: hypothetical protein JNK47_20230 [Mesorhizobium sp.]|nr:hypothetical protein [Mesorhizobium sp.]MBL8579539.1 hypothetical protein [Mesorhizobium sp.]